MVVALLSALVLVPAGFTENATLNARAAWVAGKPVHVYCAQDDAAWQAYVATLPVAPIAIPHGYTPQFGGDAAYLGPDVCNVIDTRLNKQAVDLVTLGAVLDILAVESLHMKGERDDGQTACDALHIVGRFAIAKWGFRNHTFALGQMLRGARAYLASQPTQYHTAGC